MARELLTKLGDMRVNEIALGIMEDANESLRFRVEVALSKARRGHKKALALLVGLLTGPESKRIGRSR